MDSFPAPTNFKFLARHEDLSIRNDGGWLAGLQSVSFIDNTETVKEYLQHIWKNKNQLEVISHFCTAKPWRSSTFPLQELWFKFSSAFFSVFSPQKMGVAMLMTGMDRWTDKGRRHCYACMWRMKV